MRGRPRAFGKAAGTVHADEYPPSAQLWLAPRAHVAFTTGQERIDHHGVTRIADARELMPHDRRRHAEAGMSHPCSSLPQMPANRTCTKVPPPATCGSGTSHSSTLPGPVNTTAFTVVLVEFRNHIPYRGILFPK